MSQYAAALDDEPILFILESGGVIVPLNRITHMHCGVVTARHRSNNATPEKNACNDETSCLTIQLTVDEESEDTPKIRRASCNGTSELS